MTLKSSPQKSDHQKPGNPQFHIIGMAYANGAQDHRCDAPPPFRLRSLPQVDDDAAACRAAFGFPQPMKKSIKELIDEENAESTETFCDSSYCAETEGTVISIDDFVAGFTEGPPPQISIGDWASDFGSEDTAESLAGIDMSSTRRPSPKKVFSSELEVLHEDNDEEEVCSVYVQLTGGRGGQWKLEAPGVINHGVIDPCESATSFGLENVTRMETLEVTLELPDLVSVEESEETF